MSLSPLHRVAFAVSLFGVTTVGAVSGVASLPATAQPLQTGVNLTQSLQSAEDAHVLPQSSAILLVLPELVVDIDRDEAYPVTVPLLQPLYNRYGQEIVPAESPVNLRVQPEDDGVYIVAEHVVVRGQVVPLNARSSYIPGRTDTIAPADQTAHRNRTVFAQLGNGVSSALGNSVDNPIDVQRRAIGAGAVFGTLMGLNNPETVSYIHIQPGSVQTLTLDSAVSLPFSLVAVAPPPAPALGTPEQAFTFRNSLEYGDFVDGLLKAYVDGELSQEDAQLLVQEADRFATSELGLYPLAGIRARVTANLGYVYGIDGERYANPT
ncbi:MAG: hypothetical protein AAF974_09010 [Cyanobacteria bacterium P01_E01_bin.34]